MEAGTPAATQREFPCSSCGAKLHFAPGSDALSCPYCGAAQQIAAPSQPILERSFDQALQELARRPASSLAAGGHEIQCKGCGAVTLLTGHASSCPFCDSPLIVAIEEDRETIVPESLLPFKINQGEAGQKFKDWVTSRWFAPNDLAQRAQRASIDGVYLPYYTYDALARADYVGQRGEYYYETEHYKDAQGNSQTRQVRKTRWYPASGDVKVDFDDVLVCASKSLPTPLVEGLEPWDLGELRGFDPAFLSGFMAERAALELREGFEVAKAKMKPGIEAEIRRDIGGDDQRILSYHAQHHDVTFKLFLLPMWLSSFRYDDKVFRFVVNARTGEVSGERPWSAIKIAIAVVLAILVIVGIILIVQANQ